jgi:hypothetical protein
VVNLNNPHWLDIIQKVVENKGNNNPYKDRSLRGVFSSYQTVNELNCGETPIRGIGKYWFKSNLTTNVSV